MNFYKSTHRYLVCRECGKTVKMKANFIINDNTIDIYPNDIRYTDITALCCDYHMINIDKEMYDIIRSANKKGYEYSSCSERNNSIYIRLRVKYSKIPEEIDIFDNDSICKYLKIPTDLIYNTEVINIKLDDNKNIAFDILILPNIDIKYDFTYERSTEELEKYVKYINKKTKTLKYNKMKYIISALRDIN